MKIQVVIGANYGDEGKGLVSGCLSREASRLHEKVLTVFYNGTSQRAHTFNNEVQRCLAAGYSYGSDTFYHEQFVVDPISLLITRSNPIIDPNCRVILPCDVINNRNKERERGTERHGSCGFGLFEAVKRCRIYPSFDIRIHDFVDLPFWTLWDRLNLLVDTCGKFDDEIYNMDFLMKARDWIKYFCKVKKFEKVLSENHYDRIIFEGGQGLMLDQMYHSGFPYLTPSSPGSYYISEDIDELADNDVELFYVSRSYITRHGAGPMELECAMQDINPDIVDSTNLENEFQGALRFGKINTKSLYNRIKSDAKLYEIAKPKINVVFTQLNYTNGKLCTTDGLRNIYAPDFVSNVYVSDQKDQMELKGGNSYE